MNILGYLDTDAERTPPKRAAAEVVLILSIPLLAAAFAGFVHYGIAGYFVGMVAGGGVGYYLASLRMRLHIARTVSADPNQTTLQDYERPEAVE